MAIKWLRDHAQDVDAALQHTHDIGTGRLSPARNRVAIPQLGKASGLRTAIHGRPHIPGGLCSGTHGIGAPAPSFPPDSSFGLMKIGGAQQGHVQHLRAADVCRCVFPGGPWYLQ